MNKNDKARLEKIKAQYKKDYIQISKLAWNSDIAWLVYKLEGVEAKNKKIKRSLERANVGMGKNE